MTKKERYNQFIEYFQENMPVAETELNYNTPFELLIAVILSAQCTDKRVNLVTPNLFRKYPTPELLAEATIDEIFDFIKSVSFPNNKAKHLSGMAKMLVSDFNNQVPANIDQLQKLPGVGRKTANVVGSVAFKIPAMPVDTHVQRVSNRIGLVKTKNVEQTEIDLVKNIPIDLLNISHHWLILHGRYICKARKPLCEKCGITSICVFFNSQLSK